MKKTFKKIILTIFTFMFMIGMVNAETISNSFTIRSYTYSGTPMSFPQTFRVKKTSTGKYAYCTYYSKNVPTGQTYKKGSLVKDKGMNYILKQSVIDNANSNSDFFVYQTALWIYMADKGLMEGPHNSVKTFRTKVNNSSSATAKKIRNLVSNAKKASTNDTSAPTIKIGNTSNIKFTLSNGKYVSDKITVNSSTKDFKVSITEGPSGTTYEKGSNYVKIIVPANKVSKLNTNIKFKVNNSKTVYYSYIYKTSNNSYQPMAVVFKDSKSDNASASLKLEKTTSATISKQDITTSKELPGAKLVVTNSNGKIIDEWVSTTKPHVINNLTEGTYTLKETIQPDGYILSEETITFKINSKGKLIDEKGKEVSKIVMYNQPEAKGGASISKQDITNKEEIAGAHLVIKDSNGKVIDEWVSTTKPHVIEDLKPGIYTLHETIAPNGYVLSDETITFTVKDDGTTTHVVMYNTPEAKGGVSVSKQDITNKEEIAGAHLVIKDYDGNIIDEWISTTEPHVIENLKPGIYTLNEKIAPDGYILSDETITFTVKEDGTITKVVMYNTPETKEVPVEPEQPTQEVEVEDTGSFETITSSVIGLVIILAGLVLIFKNKKTV